MPKNVNDKCETDKEKKISHVEVCPSKVYARSAMRAILLTFVLRT